MSMDLDAEATRITGIPLVTPWQVVPSDGSSVTAGDHWGEPDEWRWLESHTEVLNVNTLDRRLIVARSGSRKEIPDMTSRKRPNADTMDEQYEGTVPEPEVAEDELPVGLLDQNAVQAAAGFKAAITVRLPGGETCDAFTVVEEAFHGAVRSLDPAVVPSTQAVIIRNMLASLVIEGHRGKDGYWKPTNVLVIGRFNKSATEFRTAEGWMDTTVEDVPHLVWVLIPKGHDLEDTGVRGLCIRFLPSSGDPAWSRDGLKRYPRLDASTIVGYTKFYSGADCEAHQTKVLRSLQAIHQATTAADRPEREPDADEAQSDKDEALNIF